MKRLPPDRSCAVPHHAERASMDHAERASMVPAERASVHRAERASLHHVERGLAHPVARVSVHRAASAWAHPAARALPGLLVALLLAWLLAACGPGVGGTGTGEDALAAQGARPANVCDSELGVLLGCPPAGPAGATAPGVPDTRPWWSVDAATGRFAIARFDGAAVQLELRCPVLRFEGRWGQSDALGARYFGVLASEPGQPLASLRLQPDGPALLAQLFDIAGRPIGPPAPLAAAAPPPAAPGC